MRTRAPLRDRVRVQLQRVEAVFECVLCADRSPGKLPGLARGHEAAAEPVGEGGAEDEPPRLGAQHDVGLPRLRELRQPLHRLVQSLIVGQERHDVLEDDAALGEVRDVPDLRGQVDSHRPATGR